MRKFKNIIKNISLLIILVIAAISCENDFATVESNIVGGDNFNTESITFPLTTFNSPIPPFQSNGLPNYLLGHFNDPVYGGSSASIISQLGPTDGIFPIDLLEFSGINTVLDSVILTIPYFSGALEFNDDGEAIFDTDSIFGDSPIRLSVFENTFLLRDLDPNNPFDPQGQRFFSNASTSENDIISDSQLEGQLLFEDDDFIIDSEAELLISRDPITFVVTSSTLLAPALRVALDNPNNFWRDLLFSRTGSVELSSLNNFNNHFRGLYIKAESVSPNGTMALLNLPSANATLEFFFNNMTLDEEGNTIPELSTFSMSFSGNIVNIFDNNFNSIQEGDSINGDSQLFLKGGEGSMAVLNLFNGDSEGNSQELDDFRNFFIDDEGNSRRLLNEAFVEFQVDQSEVDGEEPDRLIIYDLNNNIPLVDFFLDQSFSDETLEARIIHLQPLVRENNDPDGEGLTYRIRITEHLNNIIFNDSTNVRLGLSVTANVDATSANLLDVQENEFIEEIPVGTALSPRGTVLFGSNHPDESRRPVFRVFFTEPNIIQD